MGKWRGNRVNGVAWRRRWREGNTERREDGGENGEVEDETRMRRGGGDKMRERERKRKEERKEEIKDDEMEEE